MTPPATAAATLPNPVHEFVAGLWQLREEMRGRVPGERATTLGRDLAAAVTGAVQQCESYDPESDVRVLWAREVLAAVRRRDPQSNASASLEASTAFLLGTREAVVEPCGKDLAAGGDW